MRLWHQHLIPLLPRQQLLGQHRECCALRGNGWGKRHAIVNYVFRYSPRRLYRYHRIVMEEMTSRGYHTDLRWHDPCYRGLSCPPYSHSEADGDDGEALRSADPIYPEHDDAYLADCLRNLHGKGIVICVPGLRS